MGVTYGRVKKVTNNDAINCFKKIVLVGGSKINQRRNHINFWEERLDFNHKIIMEESDSVLQNDFCS